MRAHALKRLRRRLADRMAPLTLMSSSDRLIVVAPHPDDETLGCGGLIIKSLAAGVDVHVVFVTDGEAAKTNEGLSPDALAAMRRDEALEAARRLGLNEASLHFLSQPDDQLPSCRDTIIASMTSIISQFPPTAVAIPHLKDPPPDHHGVAAFVLAALSKDNRGVHVYEYGIWYWRHWPWVGLSLSFRSLSRALWAHSIKRSFGSAALQDFDGYLDIADAAEQKRYALSAHRSQLPELLDGYSPDDKLQDKIEGTFLAALLGDIEIYRVRRTTGD